MSLLVVGSMAFDSILTPSEERSLLLGGSGLYASMAASFFTSVRLVSIVGNDWPESVLHDMQRRGIDTRGVYRDATQKSFHWTGRYSANMNERESLATDLNAYANFQPTIPEVYRDSPIVLLAHAHPDVHLHVLEQLRGPRWVVADTMDHWIQVGGDSLPRVFSQIDALILNEGEARLITGKDDLFQAGRLLQQMGPKWIIVKKGEHGALLLGPDVSVALPAFPTEDLKDPTGAGDSFAGGMFGYLASVAGTPEDHLKQALAIGTVMASFAVESFSLDRLVPLEKGEIESRFQAFRQMLNLPGIP